MEEQHKADMRQMIKQQEETLANKLKRLGDPDLSDGTRGGLRSDCNYIEQNIMEMKQMVGDEPTSKTMVVVQFPQVHFFEKQVEMTEEQYERFMAGQGFDEAAFIRDSLTEDQRELVYGDMISTFVEMEICKVKPC